MKYSCPRNRQIPNSYKFACKYTYPPLCVISSLDYLYLLLLLSRFSCVRLFVTPETAAHQASPSLGFSREEHWRGLPFPSPMRESEVAQSCPTLATPWTAVYQAPPSMGFSRQKYWSGVPYNVKAACMCAKSYLTLLQPYGLLPGSSFMGFSRREY